MCWMTAIEATVCVLEAEGATVAFGVPGAAIILDRVTNVAMGTKVDGVNGIEEIPCLDPNLSLRRSQDLQSTVNG